MIIQQLLLPKNESKQPIAMPPFTTLRLLGDGDLCAKTFFASSFYKVIKILVVFKYHIALVIEDKRKRDQNGDNA